MRYTKYNKSKRDANHGSITATLIHLGATVTDVSEVAGGLDIIVGIGGIDQRVEIKDPAQPASNRKLTDKEQDTFATWKGRPPVVIETDHDCFHLIERMSQ